MAGFFDETEDTTSPVETSFFDETETDLPAAPDPNAGDFSQGVKRGVQNLQAMTYGAGALVGGGLKKMGAEDVGQKLQDVGMEGYNRNIEEAKQYPKKHSFKDIYTGKTGVGGAVDWAQGTLGELVPSMVEAAGGAAIGSAVAPGAGTAVGAFASRTLMKKGIEKTLQQALKKGIGNQTEAQVRKQITKQAMKKLGGKAGIGAAVMPMESGGNYASLLEEKGIDAPETALLFGALSTSLEFLGGNSKLVDTFVDALGNGAAGLAKKSAKDILMNIPQEALQEGGQELFSILNTVVNTDEKLLTAENVEAIIESMAAGAIGGGAGSVAQAVTNTGENQTPNITPQEAETDRRVDNILTQDQEGITKSIKSLTTDIQANDTLLSSDYKTIDAKATELNITPDELIKQTIADNTAKKSLVTQINAENKAEYNKLSPEDKAVKRITDRLQAQRVADQKKTNQELDQPVDDLAVDNFLDEYAEGQTDLRDDTITRNRQQQFDALKNQVIKDQEANAETPETRERRLAFETIKKDDLTQQEQELIDRNLAVLEANRISTPEETAAVLDQVNTDIPQADVPEILDAAQSAETFLADNFTERENALIEDYWQGVKQELNRKQEEMTPGTEAAMKKQFFETKLAEIEGNVAQDIQTQTAPEQNITVPLAEQNKRQAWFQQVAQELGDFPASNPQKINQEAPRPTQAFKNEQDSGTFPQFQTTENVERKKSILDSANAQVAEQDKIILTSEEQQKIQELDAMDYFEALDAPGADELYIKQAQQHRQNLQFTDTVKLYRGGTGDFQGTQARENYNVFGSSDKNVARSYSGANGTIKHMEIPVTKVIEFPVQKSTVSAGNEFSKVGFDQRARQLGFGEVLVARNVYDVGPRADSNLDPESKYSYPSDVYAFGPMSDKQKKAIEELSEINPTSFQTTEGKESISKVNLADIQKTFPNQEILQDDAGTIHIRFKNGKGASIQSMQNAGQGFIKLAIDTGQMSENGKILGITTGTEILLDDNFADNKTLWHENKHVLDNLGMITATDNAVLNKEFNKLRKAGKLDFALSTHEDPKQRMVENRANMFAQIMVNRDAYRNTPLGKTIQKIMDFFQQLLAMGRQTISGLARETESGKIYSRKVGTNNLNTTVPQAEVAASTWYSQLEKSVAGFQQKSANANQWKGMIGNVSGLKQEELEWTGVNEWLDEQTGKVSRENLVKFIQDNNVQLEEVQNQGSSEEYDSLYEQLNERLDGAQLLKEQLDAFAEEGSELEKTLLKDIETNQFYIDGISKELENLNVTQYSGMQLPGGKDYKELLITLPEQKNNAQKVFSDYYNSLKEKYQESNYLELKDKLSSKEQAEVDRLNDLAGDEANNNYSSAHWSEPNILSHIRFNEQTDVEGNRVLFINEVQSDWHQAGRKKGYVGDVILYKDKLKDHLSQIFPFNNNPDILEKEMASLGEINNEDEFRTAAEKIGINEATISSIIKSAENDNTVADAPFKKSWPMLSLKRMVKYASENGFDKISWPSTPEQVAQIEGWGTVRTEQTDKGASYFVRGDQNVSSIMNRYLVDIPRMLNKEFNKGKWGKAKVGTSEFASEIEDLTNLDTDPANFEMFTLPITDKMRSSAMREGMAMFEVREGGASQKIPQATYDKLHEEKSSLVKNLAQQARIKLTETRQLADKALGSISTRLKNVDPELAQHLRWLDFNTSQKVIDTLKTAKPILDTAKTMSPQDKSDWSWARLNSDEGKIEQLAQKYGMTEQLSALREKLNKIRKDAQEVGYDVGFIDEYWPRVIKDQEGFLQATQEISQRPVFSEAIRDAAKKLGLTQEQFEREFPEVKADIISNLILNQANGIGGPGNIQSRVFETIDPKYAKFYMDADASLMQYVYSMTKKIEARKFFGKVPKRISDLKNSKKQKLADIIKLEQLADMARIDNPEALVQYEERLTKLNEDIARIDEPLNEYKVKNNYTENIGSYIDRMMTQGRIQKKDEKMVRDILDARFNEHGTTGIVNAYKNLAYIDTMGSPLSAITQIGDLAWAMYVGKVWTPSGFLNTGKNLAKAIAGKSDVTKEDLGIERIAQEFADGTTLSKAVSKVFKVVGLEKIDSIGKEVLVNNALAQFKADAKADPKVLEKLIRPTFGKKSADVVQEILAGNPSDNVKMLLYSRLLDFQPVALSEMPEYYLNSGNGRVFYMLKTYTLKQMDVFRKEVVHNLKSENPQQKIQGITNMVQLMSLLTLANAGADEIKDFMLGMETRFSDNVIENFLTMGGASRYTRMQVSREGFGSALAQQILPPMKFINSASKDLSEGYKDYVSGDTANFEHARIIDSIPVAGKLAYWHFGRGNENKKSLEESDFAKVKKDSTLFKKQLANADDKRLFIESNLDRFKQMKLQENFQAALNRNKGVINKLEKIPATENVLTRLGQLKAQREQILKKYFEVRESL